jgi:hypothetical protein
VIGGARIPLFQQQADGSFVMLVRPVVVTHLCASLGDHGNIIFADWSCYGVELRREGAVERNIASGWQHFAEGFRLVARFDGVPLYSSRSRSRTAPRR